MKKFGFTLTEVIIALGIIGVVAAITAPALTNLIPDKRKMTVLKVNKIIMDVNNNILQDPTLYMRDKDHMDCMGLECEQNPTRTDNKYTQENYSGDEKYAYVFADELELALDDNGNPFIEGADGNTVFITKDGLSWTVEKLDRAGTDPNDPLYAITIDLNDLTEPNCTYSNGCNKPDRFIFNINSYGKVSGGDPLTRAYLLTPDKLNNKTEDQSRANRL